ncbi:MAG TPA: hypothetical protein VGG01_10420 [Xanthobacteraceae bacterium]|jgi:hypothetical protein
MSLRLLMLSRLGSICHFARRMLKRRCPAGCRIGATEIIGFSSFVLHGGLQARRPEEEVGVTGPASRWIDICTLRLAAFCDAVSQAQFDPSHSGIRANSGRAEEHSSALHAFDGHLDQAALLASRSMISTPNVIVVGGPNGAGKSTSAPHLLRDTLAVTEFVNADAIAGGLSAFRPESAAVAAGKVMLARMRQLAANRESFAFETTLASRSFAPWLRGATTRRLSCARVVSLAAQRGPCGEPGGRASAARRA